MECKFDTQIECPMFYSQLGTKTLHILFPCHIRLAKTIVCGENCDNNK